MFNFINNNNINDNNVVRVKSHYVILNNLALNLYPWIAAVYCTFTLHYHIPHYLLYQDWPIYDNCCSARWWFSITNQCTGFVYAPARLVVYLLLTIMRVHADIILYLTTLQWYTIYTAVITITYIRAVVCGIDVDPLSNEVCEITFVLWVHPYPCIFAVSLKHQLCCNGILLNHT